MESVKNANYVLEARGCHIQQKGQSHMNECSPLEARVALKPDESIQMNSCLIRPLPYVVLVILIQAVKRSSEKFAKKRQYIFLMTPSA